jgi:hypothetical protein
MEAVMAEATDLEAEVMDSAAAAMGLMAEATDLMAEPVGSMAEAADTTVEAMGTMEDTADTTVEAMGTTDTADTTEDTIDPGIVATMDITVTGGRGYLALAGVIRGTRGMGTMDIPITAPTTIRPMATRMGGTPAAITAGLTTEMAMSPLQKWPSCNADFRGLAITQVLSMESWALRPGEQFALTNATVGN